MFHMASTAKARRRVEAPASFDTIADDLATLKRDFARLMDQMKTGAIDGASETAQNLLEQLNERASELYESMSDQGERSVKAITRQVEERPITSLLVAFGIGMLVSRLLSR
jgi:ElaB/YqjD/DUF883 family membrane-anchored ribosome-binding protein